MRKAGWRFGILLTCVVLATGPLKADMQAEIIEDNQELAACCGDGCHGFWLENPNSNSEECPHYPAPCAPLCGTECGMSYLSMGLALALVVGVAAVVLSSSSSHSH